MNRLERWLEANGLKHLVPVFSENRIGADVLADLTVEDLKELGLPLGDRKRLLKAIAAGVPPSTDEEGREDASPGEAEAELRQVTIVFMDLVGSTELASRLDPEEMAELMAAYQDRCVESVRRWGGHLAEFLGDGAVVYFGWPRAFEDDAERAVRAALECTEAVASLERGDGQPLSARAGIATGLVMVGEIRSGHGPSREGVVGETPNVAARVQSLAPPGAVVVTAETRKLLGDRFTLDALGEKMVKGIDRPLALWRVTGTRRKSRFDARTGDMLLPIVGRQAEISQLRTCWDSVVRGRGHTALIEGEAGIGKSRLVRAAAEDLDPKPSRVITLQCSPYHVGTPLLPVIEWLRDELGVAVDVDPTIALADVKTLLAAGGHPGEAVPLLASLLSVPLSDDYQEPNLSPQLRRSRTMELLLDLMLPTEGDTPVLVAVEDLHWADPTTRAMLERLTDQIVERPVMLVMTSRPDAPTEFTDEALLRITLKRLDSAASSELIRALSGTEVADGVIQSILSSADGVPLFVEELTLALKESGRLGGGSATSSAGAESLGVPTTLQDLLLARLDSLTRAKPVAQVASTLGRSFTEELLAAVAPALSSNLEDCLKELLSAGILYPERRPGEGVTYAFRHALMREAAYRSQLKARRRRVHLDVARTLESRYPTIVRLEPELVAHHYAEAGSTLPAATYLLSAGQRGLHSGATHEAIVHLRRGLDLLRPLEPSPERDRTELLLHATLGTATMQARGFGAQEVEQAYTAAANLTDAAESVAEEVWILWGLWVYHEVRGSIKRAIEVSERIQEVAVRGVDPDSKLVADMVSLQVLLYGGRFQESDRHCEAFRRAFDPLRHRWLSDLYSTDLELIYFVHRAIGLWITGNTEASHELRRRAEALVEDLAYPFSTAWFNTWGSVVHLFEGRTEEVERRTDLGISIGEEQGFAYVAALGKMMAGWAQGQSDPHAGVAVLKAGIEEFRATGAEIVLPYFNALLAALLTPLDRCEEALDVLARALQQIGEGGERWPEAEVHRICGNVLTVKHGPTSPEAEASYRRALHVAVQQGARRWQLRASTDLARCLHASGREEEALSVLASILPDFEDSPPAPDLEEAGALMDQIGR